jgi:hypothetical protein
MRAAVCQAVSVVREIARSTGQHSFHKWGQHSESLNRSADRVSLKGSSSAAAFRVQGSFGQATRCLIAAAGLRTDNEDKCQMSQSAIVALVLVGGRAPGSGCGSLGTSILAHLR